MMHKTNIQRNKKKEVQAFSQQAIPMLSELHIELPKPTITAKQSPKSHQNPYISEYQVFSPIEQTEGAPIREKVTAATKDIQSTAQDYNFPRYKYPQSPSSSRSEGEIILGWIRNLFQKKNLLGPHWEDKIRQKRASLVRNAFQKMKQQRHSVNTLYLQTQSKHKPYVSRQKHLVIMGLQKLHEACSAIALKSKRSAFSKILRYLAFQNTSYKPNSKLDSFALQQESTGSLNSRNQGRQQRNIHQSPKQQIIKPVYAKQASTPRKVAKGNDYVPTQDALLKGSIKQVQSSKNLVFAANEYALSPVSPVKQQWTEKKTRKDNFIVTESKMSRNSDKSKANRELVNSKSQPQMAIGGIGGNFKYEFNQHNYIVVQPDAHHIPAVSPPSPLSHQLTPNIKFHAPEVRPINFHPVPIIMKQSTHPVERRDPNYIRPHSHNPFQAHNNQTAQQQQMVVDERPENRKSRSISASANIKISFMSKEEMRTREAKPKGNDYLQEERNRYQDIHKLGTAENRRMRQHYQQNSYGNQLIPQDYALSPPTPNYLYSSPVSPKPQQFQSKQIHANYMSPAPQSPMTPRTPRQFGYQSYLPISPQPRELPKQMKQSVQIAPSDFSSKRLVREKILVTSSQRQR